MLGELLRELSEFVSLADCKHCPKKYCEGGKISCKLLADIRSVEHDMVVVKAGLRVIETLTGE